MANDAGRDVARNVSTFAAVSDVRHGTKEGRAVVENELPSVAGKEIIEAQAKI